VGAAAWLARHRCGGEGRRHSEQLLGGDEQHFDELTGRRFSADGPLLLAAKIDDKPGPIQTRNPALIRNRSMKRLGVGTGRVMDYGSRFARPE
jgi:hypothetical protein